MVVRSYAVASCLVLWFFTGLVGAQETQSEPVRPNVLWISVEDIGCDLGCYGQPLVHTPTLDEFAGRGVRFTRAFTIAGVCAVNRSGTITGVYPTSYGAQHMRCSVRLPEALRPFPHYLREAGYYCTNNSKTDYNFDKKNANWHQCNRKAHWRSREAGQPFFAVFNLTLTHESCVASITKHKAQSARLPDSQRVDRTRVTPPPYHPDTPIVREEWARYYDNISAMDLEVKRILGDLAADGLADDTIVFFWSDHGAGTPRNKRWLYDSGVHVPLIVYAPPKWRAWLPAPGGQTSDRLVSSLDLGPTVLALAGLERPETMRGTAFLGAEPDPPREYVFGHRDRMDERQDIIRSVRDDRYRYVRNYQPWKPYYQYMSTPEGGPTMKELRRMHPVHQLPEAAERFMADHKPAEELYDLQTDPHELQNLAMSRQPEHRELLRRFRAAHREWMLETRDTGLIPETELVRREAELGDRMAILAGEEGKRLLTRLIDAASRCPRGDRQAIDAALADADPAVRYWGWIGVGLSTAPRPWTPEIADAMQDPAAAVRIEAARAAVRHNHRTDEATEVLVQALAHDDPTVRWHAATVLDETGWNATKAVEALRLAQNDKENKYVARVAKRALARWTSP